MHIIWMQYCQVAEILSYLIPLYGALISAAMMLESYISYILYISQYEWIYCLGLHRNLTVYFGQEVVVI